MANSTDNKGDASKRDMIYLYEIYEVQYWMRKFGVSEDELKSAVKAVGHRARDVEKYFQNKKR